MRRLFFLLGLVFLVSCSRSVETSQSALDELIAKDGYWKIAGGDAFADGGTYCLSFITPSGRIIHVAARPNSMRKNGELVFELWSSYEDKNHVVLEPKSRLEQATIWLLGNYAERSEIKIGRNRSRYHSRSRTLIIEVRSLAKLDGAVAVVCAGTSDLPVERKRW